MKMKLFCGGSIVLVLLYVSYIEAKHLADENRDAGHSAIKSTMTKEHKCLELFEKEEDAKAFPKFEYQIEYPECWESIKPKFKLFTKTKSKNCIIADAKTELFDLKSCLALVELKAMVSLRKIVFIIHGFKGKSGAGKWPEDMADLIIEHEKNKDVAVVTIDWREGASIDIGSLVYGQAAANARYVGLATARIIDQLRILKPNARIHCIGHSIGAHACGFAGKETSIDRISGMDPAGPLFQKAKVEERLDKNDATNVDVLHTDGDTFGLMKPIGDIDFYAGMDDNHYGADQSGCGIDPVCDHKRSYKIYRATIADGLCTPEVKCLGTKQGVFTSETLKECENWNKEPGYGYWYDGGFTGLYGFTAEKEEPYCHHYGKLRCKGQENGCCTEENPCEEGEGDCDNNHQCKGKLVCGKDNCPKDGKHWDDGDDCCFNFEDKPGPDKCKKTNDCGVDHGDCSGDGDCEMGLVCGENNCKWNPEGGGWWTNRHKDDCCH